MSAAPKQPQDRKSKTLGPGEFTHDGKTYQLPPPSEAMQRLPGRALRDAVLDGQEGELRLAFLVLEAVGAPKDTLDALYAKPVPEMMRIVGAWMTSADLSGATLPE